MPKQTCMQCGSVAILMLNALPLLAQSTSTPISEVETLRGRTKMSLSVVDTDGSNSIDQNKLSATLRNSGITVLPSGAYPKLQFTLTSVRTTTRCGSMVTPAAALSLRLEFVQLVKIGNSLVAATTHTDEFESVGGGFGGAGSLIAEAADNDVKEFLKDFRSVNEKLASPLTTERKQTPLVGDWKGSYSCRNAFLGNLDGQLQWTIAQDSSGTFDVNETWTKAGSSGRVHYAGTYMGDTLVLKADGNAYKIFVYLSADKTKITGDYHDHPGGCLSLELHRND